MRNATTGTLVAKVTVPQGYPGTKSRTFITGVATGNGRDYVVAEYANPCRSWLFQFRLDNAGHPSAVTPFAALPTVPSELYGLTVSANGQMVGFTTTACQGAKAQPNYVGVTDIATGHTTRWTTPGRNSVDAVSLTADGRQLCLGNAKPMTGQIRAMDLATGRSRLIFTPKGGPGVMTFDPGARYLLMQVFEDGQHPARLVRLDLATGEVAYPPSRRFSLPALLYW